ncbi:MAG: helix-turn-helix domain-containing protein [archaeon]|jgi:sugar-specific transcriptional regulator TrmB
MDTSILEDLGLTNAEIKVYLALLELGSTKAGRVIENTNLQNSVVHMTLHKLVNNGFATFIKKGSVKYYQPTDPSHILDFIEDKKKRFREILPTLLEKQKFKEKEEAEIYEGFKGLKTMLHEMIKDAKKGDEFVFFTFFTKNNDDYQQIFNYYKEFEKEREEKGIIVHGIAPESIRNKFTGRNPETMIFVNYPIPLNCGICNDKIMFTTWEDKKTSVLIHSKQLANQYRELFYSIWNKEKGITKK